MKKIILALSSIVIVPVFLIVITTLFIDFNKIYENLLKSNNIDVAALEKDNLIVHKFPRTYLNIRKLTQKDKFTLTNIQIRFSWMSLLKLSPQISDIKIDEAVVYLAHNDVSIVKHDEFISELLGRGALKVNADVKKVTFIEADKDIPIIIEQFRFWSNGNNTSFTGVVDEVGAINGSFINQNNQIDFNLVAKGVGYNFEINEYYKDLKLTNGNIKIKTNNLSHKIAQIIPDISQFASKLDSSEEVALTCDILSEPNWLILKNIAVNAQSLEGKGELSLRKQSSDINQLTLEFSKIDLKNWSKNTAHSAKAPINLGSRSRYDFWKNKLNANISIKDMQIDEANFMQNINWQFNVQDGKLYVKELSGTIDQNSSFYASGIVDQNAFRNIFNGTLSITHSDLNHLAALIGGKEITTSEKIPYSLVADVSLSSVDMSLQNLILKTPDLTVNGYISTKFIGSSPRTNANLKISQLNINRPTFPGVNNIYQYIKDLTRDMKSENYLSKFIPIRKINAMSNYNITFSKIILDKKTYEDINLNLNIAPGSITIDNLYIHDKTDYIDISLNLSAQNLKPKLTIKIQDGAVGVNFLSPSAMLNLRKYAVDNLDMDKIDSSWDIALSKAYQNNLVFNNLKLKAHTEKSLITIDNLEANVFAGKLTSSGSILLQPYTLNFVYALNSANIKEIANILPDGVYNSDGFVSIRGMLSTNGNDLNSLLYNLYTKSNFIAKDTVINNFSIDDIVQMASMADYDLNNFKSDIKKALLTGTTKVKEMKSDLELSKGVLTLPLITFTTQNTSATASATMNIYDFKLNISSKFSFYLASQDAGRNFVDYKPTNLTVTTLGSFFAPNKEADTTDFEQALLTHAKK